jgi:ribonucleoside-diphosphate reductase alpha chain
LRTLNKSAIDSANRDRRPAAEPAKREFTSEEKNACSIEAMRAGGTCEACQ